MTKGTQAAVDGQAGEEAPSGGADSGSEGVVAGRDRLAEWLFRRVPVDSLAVLRVYFGIMMVARCLAYLGGDLKRFYIDTVFHFKFAGFGWVEAPSETVLYGLMITMLACAVCLVIGFLVRPAAGLYAVAAGWILLIDKAAYNNHDYLIVLVAGVLACMPSGSKMRGVVDGRVEQWTLQLMRFTLGLPYVFGAVAKMNPDWMFRWQPMRVWLESGRIEGRLRFDWFQEPWAAAMFSWGGLLLDLLIVPALLYPRTRAAAFVAITAFHLTNSQLFTIGVFPWLMIGATTIFLPPAWPRQLFRLLGGGRRVEAGTQRRGSKGGRRAAKGGSSKGIEVAPATWTGLTVRQRVVVFGLAAWVAVHCFLPFRHLAFPGWVDWTEEAHVFAWRMKIRDKVGRVDFALVDPVTGDFQPISQVDALLTQRQRRMMLHDPEMVRQFAVYLRKRLEAAGQSDREVRAATSISLNGRPPQQLIQPTVDLSRLAPGTLAPEWLVPLEPILP